MSIPLAKIAFFHIFSLVRMRCHSAMVIILSVGVECMLDCCVAGVLVTLDQVKMSADVFQVRCILVCCDQATFCPANLLFLLNRIL